MATKLTDMPKFFQQHAIVALILLIIIVGTLGFMAVLRPAVDAFRLARAEAGRVEKEYVAVSRRLEQASAFVDQLNAASPAELKKLRGMFLMNPEPAYILNLISERAQLNRFLLTTLEVGGESEGAQQKTGPLQEIGIQAQLKGGGYTELKELLKSLTRAVPLIELVSFTFEPRSSTVALNMKAKRVKTQETAPVPVDTKFFSDARFKALRDLSTLPTPGSIGKKNPFAESEAPPTPPSQ